MPPPDPVASSAAFVYDSFQRYDANYRRITRRAARRFVERDWAGAQSDRVERLELWEKSVARAADALEARLGSSARDRNLWHRMKELYGARIDRFGDAEFARTFFTSVARRTFDVVGVDPLIEFVLDLEPDPSHRVPPATRVYIDWGDREALFARVLDDFELGVPYEDAARDAGLVRDDVERMAWRHYRHPRTMLRVELMEPVFYQSTRAFLVGKIEGEEWTAPFAIELEHGESGVAVSAVHMSDSDMAILFGFTRAYFFVDLRTVSSVVHFLEPLMPGKPIDELYSVLGRIRQAKTERYRGLARHLRRNQERFVHAPGTKGMVMIVFTLPRYHLVFKVIRDRFPHAKKVNRRQVVERYRMVSRHDRVGRMIDTQAFRNLVFDRERFSDELLAELTAEANETVRVEDDRVVFRHLYMERKVRPLNLFVQEASWLRAREAIRDYGRSIKEMARINIFPGDMLLKNFGVTRHGRVIFYDFDEVVPLTDCRFRRVPPARDELTELYGDVWFDVAENDVFPEEFKSFLGLSGELQAAFLEEHADLLDAGFWQAEQARHAGAAGA